MSDIQKKLEDYLNGNDSEEYYPNEDVVMMDKMMDLISNLNTKNLSEDQMEEIAGIIDFIADENIDEAVSAKKVKIKPSEKRKRHRDYRKNRAALKLKAKKFRRTTKYKQYTRAKKRRAGAGKTATGKRIRTFL